MPAYGLLGLQDYSETKGNKFTLNFEVESVADSLELKTSR
jgi:hypothetical protein